MESLQGKVALIAGAGNGFGFAAAEVFLRAGINVVAVSDKRPGLERLAYVGSETTGKLTLVPCDDEITIPFARLAPMLHDRFGKLDYLLSASERESELGLIADLDGQEFEAALRSKVTLNRNIIRACDPLLRAAPTARVLFAVNASLRFVRPYCGTEAIAQAALCTLARAYAAESVLNQLRINLVDPGYCTSRFSLFERREPDFFGSALALLEFCSGDEIIPVDDIVPLREHVLPQGLPARAMFKGVADAA